MRKPREPAVKPHKRRFKHYAEPGTPPGRLVPDPHAATLRLRAVDYSDSLFDEREHISLQEGCELLQTRAMTWIHAQGDPDAATLNELGARFGLHPLALEDVLHQGQRPKLDDFDGQLFVVLMLPVQNGASVELRQVSLFAGETFIVSFCAGSDDPFEPVRKRLRRPDSTLRRLGPDGLLHALTDLVVDRGFPVLEALSTQIDTLENTPFEGLADRAMLGAIYQLRRELLALRRVFWPQRELFNALVKDEHPLLARGERLYFRDCRDHAVQLLEMIEQFREMADHLLDLHLAASNHRLNEIIRLLTLITVLFIPPTFIVGVYGMNFDTAQPWNMPELAAPYGYLAVWAVIVGVMGGMLAFFKRRGWL